MSVKQLRTAEELWELSEKTGVRHELMGGSWCRRPELDPSPLRDFGSVTKMAEAETGRMLKKSEAEAVYWGG
jgi:hypothetical protein